jgi:L-alanine-DL-glutamate epimerase-like enolase superfamily enzyme
MVAAGLGALKVKLDADVEASVRRMEAVRDVVGSEVALRGDANGAWSVSQARSALQRLAAVGLEFVEQPVPATQVDDMAVLRRISTVPVGADESLLIEGGVARVLDAEAADVLVLKPTLLGGLAEAWRVAQVAGERGVDVVVTSALESAIGVTAALHLAASLPRLPYACGLATSDLLADDVAEPPLPEDGRMKVPTGAGLGVEPDLAKLGA